MNRTLDIIARAYTVADNPVVAFSGGTDSAVLLDIVYTKTEHRPPVLFQERKPIGAVHAVEHGEHGHTGAIAAAVMLAEPM